MKARALKKLLAATLAIAMCASTALPVLAAETIWHGDDVKLDITKGTDPYVYAIAQDPANNLWYYETSNHAIKREVTTGGAVHIFPMVDTTKVTGEWIPSGIYKIGESNFDVMYCCDAVTGTSEGIYYKRVNLEDSEYVSAKDAARLRAIVENAYPYVSVEEAKAALKAAGFAQADELDRSELIAATQAAIWTIANPDSGDSYRYNKTATTAKKLTWGGYMHEFASEITNFTDSLTSAKYLANPNGVGDRVNALIDFYLAMEGIQAENSQIVITKLDISNSKVDKAAEVYDVQLSISLNHGADEDDSVFLNVFVDGQLSNEVIKITEATDYTVNVQAKANADIKVAVSGTQNLERGVYFYIPEPQDIDGDGIATSREVSQNLIGVAVGETPVYAEETVKVRKINKTSTELNNEDMVDVTLTVGGDSEYSSSSSLPVDIIYILGSFLSTESKVNQSTMINVLIDTFRDLIEQGVPVNFGIVPFSSTKDPVMPLTPLTSEADLEALPAKIAAAVTEAGNVYDQVNMENALLTATELFADSALGKMGRTDRQHLILVSSGHTYYFNGGENNEYISTVPAMFKKGTVDTNEIFFQEKVWMRARNNSTNSYPIPKAIVEYYNANKDKYASEWDCYWSIIDQWAKADIAAGDKIVYNATTREAGDFINWPNPSKVSSASGTFTKTGYGLVIANPDPEQIDGILKFDLDYAGENVGPNPFEHEFAAHAISYERAMWEAFTFIQENVTGEGINFYPVYNPLRVDGTASNGSHYDYDWTTNYIGHCFMNMLAGGEAVVWSTDKVFFDGIKAEIIESATSSDKASYVEDFIGKNENGNFEFIQNPEYVTLVLGGVTYTTAQVETKEGFDFSLAFTAPDAEEATFWLDYVYGDGETTEMFVWTFGEYIDPESTVTLTYKLKLIDKQETAGTYIVPTNNSATLYPFDREGNALKPQLFPVPEVEYDVASIEISGVKTWVDENNLDGSRPASITINLLANGVIIDTKTVTEADDWAWTFSDLPRYKNGEEIVYTITEEAVAGYETVVDGFNVTNTHVPVLEEPDDPEVPLGPGEEPEDPEVPLGPGNLPETGDNSDLFMWIAAAAVSGALLITAVKGRKEECEE